MVIRRAFSAYLGAAIAAVATLPGSASAQSVPASAAASLVWSKSDAILGQPSALQAILAQQGAAPRGVVQPSSYSVPVTYASGRARPLVRDAADTGRPDVFGTVALHVARTPLDSRWRRVHSAGLGGAPARYAESLRDLDDVARLDAVNRYVNRRVRFTDDQVQFGRADIWSTANETLKRGRGDCEDYAIAKMQMLRRAGLSSRDLYLVILRDLARRSDHAVLVARAGGRMFLLDNGTDKLLETGTVSDYRPMLTFASYGEWTHGYRIASPPVTIAAAAPAREVTLASLAGDQRSRSASLLAFNTGFSK